MRWQRKADAAIAISTFVGLVIVWPADGHDAAATWLLLMFAIRWGVRVGFCVAEALREWCVDK